MQALINKHTFAPSQPGNPLIPGRPGSPAAPYSKIILNFIF